MSTQGPICSFSVNESIPVNQRPRKDHDKLKEGNGPGQGGRTPPVLAWRCYGFQMEPLPGITASSHQQE